MLWASDALGRDGRPAVLLLAVTRSAVSLTAELAYVAADLPGGPLPGRYYRGAGSEPEAVTLEWPTGWPAVAVSNKLHPRQGTPEAVVKIVNGQARVRLNIMGGTI